jgi:hypothetical protein
MARRITRLVVHCAAAEHLGVKPDKPAPPIKRTRKHKGDQQ